MKKPNKRPQQRPRASPICTASQRHAPRRATSRRRPAAESSRAAPMPPSMTSSAAQQAAAATLRPRASARANHVSPTMYTPMPAATQPEHRMPLRTRRSRPGLSPSITLRNRQRSHRQRRDRRLLQQTVVQPRRRPPAARRRSPASAIAIGPTPPRRTATPGDQQAPTELPRRVDAKCVPTESVETAARRVSCATSNTSFSTMPAGIEQRRRRDERRQRRPIAKIFVRQQVRPPQRSTRP